LDSLLVCDPADVEAKAGADGLLAAGPVLADPVPAELVAAELVPVEFEVEVDAEPAAECEDEPPQPVRASPSSAHGASHEAVRVLVIADLLLTSVSRTLAKRVTTSQLAS